MVRIGDAHVGRGVRGDVGDHVVIDAAVVGVQLHRYRDVGIQGLEVRDGLLVDLGLGLVGVVLGPEGDLILPRGIEALGHLEGAAALGAVAAGERQRAENQRQRETDPLDAARSHPLIPPLETPAMTFLRKTRNSTISGTLMTTTAAIMAGMFSRPKPFSRIS